MTSIFTKKLQEKLIEQDMTQSDLARMIGTTEGCISRYINGSRIPRPAILQKIATALGCTVEFFQEESNEKESDLNQVRLILARNAKNLTDQEKMSIIRLLS